MFVSIRNATLAVTLLIAGCEPHVAAPSPAADETTPPDEFVVTRHEVDLGDRTMSYTARTGMLPLYENETGELMARMFIIAYVGDRGPGEPARPVTFVWNGGPGASSSQVHLVGFGPKGLDTPETYPEWFDEPPTEIVDRPNTWLADSDLVFVDPIGTGYSRAASEEYRDILYTTWGDIEAVAEMIRLYRTRFDAWDQPVFLAGESYGTTRAMGVADTLERRHTGIAGVILISGFYDAGQDVSPALRTALQVPMYAAAAHYHGRLAPDLQAMTGEEAVEAAEEWARREYVPALERLEALTPAETTAVLAGIERYTGVASKFVDPESLAFGANTFADRLLDDRNLELGHYDYRMTFPRRDLSGPWVPTRDPSLSPMRGLMSNFPPTIRYFRHTLGYKSDLYYQGPFGGAFHPRPLENVLPGEVGHWGGIYTDWMAVKWNHGTAMQAAATADAPQDEEAETPPLQRAMEMNPDMLVWNVKGKYDGSCAALDEAVARTPEHLRGRVRSSCYAGGHMLYTEIAVRRELKRDFSLFVRDALAARTGE
jgi:carboxypeptidase C (cathepsin A)